MTTTMIVATIVASSLVSIVVGNITAKMYMLQRKIQHLESKLDAIDRYVDRIDGRVYALENENKVKPKNKTDEK